jgi:hypothetical protein
MHPLLQLSTMVYASNRIICCLQNAGLFHMESCNQERHGQHDIFLTGTGGEHEQGHGSCKKICEITARGGYLL